MALCWIKQHRPPQRDCAPKNLMAIRVARDWRHFGRLAGFTNRKPKYQQDNGHFPFVKLREATGIEYDRRSELLQQAHGVIEQERAAERKRQEQYQQARSMAPARQDSKGFSREDHPRLPCRPALWWRLDQGRPCLCNLCSQPRAPDPRH